MTPDEHSIAWQEVMAEISRRIKQPIDGFAITIILDNGATTLYGADFSRNPKVRGKLADHSRRVIREIAHLEKRGGNITAIYGKEIQQ